MKQKILATFAFFSFYILAEEPILIFTYVYNRPDFIETHIKTFNAFLQEDYEYIVFNDSPNVAMSNKIEQVCKYHNVQCVRVPVHAPHRQSPNCRHMDGIKYSLKKFGLNHNRIIMLVDADMFLIKPFSVVEYMKNYNFIGGYQYRSRIGERLNPSTSDLTNGFTFKLDPNKVIYTSPCLTFMNMATLPNKETIDYDGGKVEGLACDVGGQTYHYFKNNPQIKLKLYLAVSKDYLITLKEPLSEYGYDPHSTDLILNNKRQYAFQYHADGNFLHFYAGGSNWPKYSAAFIQEKTNLMNTYINNQIEYYETKKAS